MSKYPQLGSFERPSFLALVLVLSLSVGLWFRIAAAAGESSTHERARIDDILVWRLAEEMRLTADQEDRFIRELRALHSQRREVQNQMNLGLEPIRQLLSSEKEVTEAQFEARVRTQREFLRRQQALQVEEIEIVRRIAGARGVSRYLVARADLIDRMTQLLAQPMRPAASPAGNRGP